MPSWGASILAAIALSIVSAWGFLLLRCRMVGRPFGPRAKWWAVTVIAITAIVATGLGVAAVAVSHHIRAAYVGLIVPSGLWLGEVAAQRRIQHGSPWPKSLAVRLLFPLRRLHDRMGDDLQDWCDVRLGAVLKAPQWLAEAVKYYYNQVESRVRDAQVAREVKGRRDSIVHKMGVVRLIDRGAARVRVHDALQSHPSTRGMSRYTVPDLEFLADVLVSDAESELLLFLAHLYRLGFRKLLIYPFSKWSPATRSGPVP